jgi:hypothetical protein
MVRLHASESDTPGEPAKVAASSVGNDRTTSVDHELRDGSRVLAVGPRSEVMRAARRVSHGATVGRVGGEPSFMWLADAGAWVFLGI